MKIETEFDIKPYKEKLIDIFTKFYGEHNRHFVELKFNKTTFLNMYDFHTLCNKQPDDEKRKELLDFEEKLHNFQKEKLLSEFPNVNESLLFDEDLFSAGLIETFEFEGEMFNERKIEYFKTIGIDLGDNYQDYLNNPEAVSKIPPLDIIEKLKNIKTHLLREYELSLNYAYSSFYALTNYLRENNMDSYIIPSQLIQFIIEADPLTFCVQKDQQLVLLVMMNFLEKSFSLKDRGLFHEINHCMSFTPIKIGKNFYHYQMGFISNFVEKTNVLYYEEEPLSAEELFDEVINDLISIDVLNLANNEGFSVLGDADVHSAYEDYFPLVEPFYKEFKEDIKEFYITGNFQTLYKHLSKRDLNKLIDIVGLASHNMPDQPLQNTEYEEMANNLLEKITKKSINRRR